MYKLSFFLVISIYFTGCAESGHFNVDFSKETSSIVMKPTRYLTTWNFLEITGKIDCDITIFIPGKNPISLKAGEIGYSKRIEWFDAGNTIKIVNEGCSEKSYMKIYYNYTASYW